MAGSVARGAGFGLLLAALGTVVLTPDAMFMRLSEMSGFQMTAWRGFLMGGVMLLAWAMTSRDRAGDIRQIPTRAGLLIVVCQFFNSMLFCLGIAAAPAAIVLIGIAAVPVFSALLSWVILREATHPLTWIAIVAVLFGIFIAITGKGAQFDVTAVIGVAFGLGGALVLAILTLIWRALFAATVNHELADAEGMHPERVNIIFMLLMAAVIAISMKIVGVLLITAMLIIPTAAARRFSSGPEQMALLAAGIGAAAVIAGLFGSLEWDTPAGHSIVVAALLLFILSIVPLFSSRRQNRPVEEARRGNQP